MAITTGKAVINVTPLIDILLVLLIIFMMIVPTMPTGLEAQIPREAVKGDDPPVRTVVIQVRLGAGAHTEVSINGEAVASGDLRARLLDIYKQRAEKVAFVQADAEVDFNEVAEVIDVAHAAGVETVGLMK